METKYETEKKEKELIIQQFKDGDFITNYEKFKLTFHGLPFTIDIVEVDNEEVSPAEVKLNGNNSIEITKDFTELHIIGK